MHLSKSAKISVGIATLLVFLLPFLFVIFWLFMVATMSSAASTPSNELDPNSFPFNSFDLVFNAMIPVVCLLNLLIYGLLAFYVFHAIRNDAVSDIIRTISILAIFLIPFFGMPLYYFLFILLPAPPAWTIKKQLAPTA